MYKDKHNPLEIPIGLDLIIESSPGYICWKDLNSIYLGCNQNFANLYGLANPIDIVGRKAGDFAWNEKEVAAFHDADNYVIKTRCNHKSEMVFPLKTLQGFNFVVQIVKSPLLDSCGNAIGVLTVINEINKTKAEEMDNRENSAILIVKKEQEKFKEITRQVIHDIGSPLAAMRMVLPECGSLPERVQSVLNIALSRLTEITNDFLNTVTGEEETLSLASLEKPEWICSKIEVTNDNILVVLDDDPSMLVAWESKLLEYVPSIKHKLFVKGNEAIDYINSQPDAVKEKVFLLTDYELLNQGLNGLDVVRQTQVKSSVLVTSHHNSPSIRELANKTNTKILPKIFVDQIQIHIIDKLKQVSMNHQSLESFDSTTSVDLVIVDDDYNLVSVLLKYVLKDRLIDTYHDPENLLSTIENKYSKATKILIANEFKHSKSTGLDISEQLYKLGFKNLYLYTGKNFHTNELPAYLQTIAKADIDALQSLLY